MPLLATAALPEDRGAAYQAVATEVNETLRGALGERNRLPTFPNDLSVLESDANQWLETISLSASGKREGP